MKYKCVSSPGRCRSSGVAILFHPTFQVVREWRDDNGRLIIAEFARDNFNFQVGCLYAPNTKNEGAQFFESLYPVIDGDIPVLLCGDFNTVVDPHLDRFGCNPNSPWAYNWSSTLSDLMGTFDLCDVWRARHPDVKEFTWRRPNGAQGSRIDMVWLPQRYLGLVTSVGIFPFFRSDHSYVYLEIDFPFGVERNKGLWKFNSSHLKDEAFCTEIEQFWLQWRAEQGRFSALSSWWDAGKARLKLLIQRLSRAAARESRRSIDELNIRIRVLQRRINDGEQLSGLMAEAKAALETKLQFVADGARTRARLQWAEEGERSTAYFLRQEKVRGQRRLINGIRRRDGSVASSTKEMIDVWVDYYHRLFTSQHLEEKEQCVFLNSLERSLSSAESELCEGDLTEEECERALRQMSSNKSPGVDGLTAEFYVRFWGLLGPDLVNVLNSCYRLGRLSPSQRSGMIMLLYKKNDILDTANWRPITLLCVDYKIAAKALSNRLLRVAAQVVSPDQSCGIPGRFIGENLRLLHDVVDYAHSESVPGAILSLDQEKAFDRVEWAFMTKVLVKMGFGQSFISWVQLLYTEVHSAVIVNGFVSDLFPVSRGVRQGCPLSPLLYVFVAESLACAIRADPIIDGFPLPGGNKRVKVVQYADDTSTFVTKDVSVHALFELFEKYELASGAKLNQSKCHGLLLGTWRNRTSFPVELRWSASEITALGSRISHDGSENWGPPVKKLENTLSQWRRRKLSFRGRALLVNTLGLSLFWYLGSAVPVDSDLIKSVNRTVFHFLWNKPREWLSRVSVTQPKARGGLGVVDLPRKLSSLRVMWVKRFLVGDAERPWQCFFRHWLRKAFLAEPIERVFLLRDIGRSTMRRLPPFYRGVLEAWSAVQAEQHGAHWSIVGTHGVPFPLEQLTARKAYTLMGESAVTAHRCVARYASLNIDWPTVWRSLDLLRYIRPVQDTAWLAAHGVLPTTDRLARFGMRVSPRCHCGATETQDHLFVECPHAVEMLDWFCSLLRRYRPSMRRPSSREIRFSFVRADAVPAGFSALMAVVRHNIWVARNAFRFDGLQPDPALTLRRIKNTFCFLLRVQRRHCTISVFERCWLAGGVLGALREDIFLPCAELHSTP